MRVFQITEVLDIQASRRPVYRQHESRGVDSGDDMRATRRVSSMRTATAMAPADTAVTVGSHLMNRHDGSHRATPVEAGAEYGRSQSSAVRTASPHRARPMRPITTQTVPSQIWTMPREVMLELSRYLSALRRAKGLSQEEVAYRAGMAVPTYQRLESSARAGSGASNPRIGTVMRALRVLDADGHLVNAISETLSCYLEAQHSNVSILARRLSTRERDQGPGLRPDPSDIVVASRSQTWPPEGGLT